MFSSDKNIEIIGQLVKLLKHSIGLQADYLKLDVMDKTVRVVTALLLFVILALVVVAIAFFLSLSVALALGSSIGYPAAFGAVGLFYVIVFILFVSFRKTWIERPLIRFITSLLTE